jgi:uncharacterized protein YcaQ
MTIHLSRAQARDFLTTYHFTPTDMMGVFTRLGTVQYDPLNPVGRNPDLVLQARVPGYCYANLCFLLLPWSHVSSSWGHWIASSGIARPFSTFSTIHMPGRSTNQPLKGVGVTMSSPSSMETVSSLASILAWRRAYGLSRAGGGNQALY